MTSQEKALAMPGGTRWDPFVAMDKLDDEAIVAELSGRVVKALAYSFTQGGKEVQGLSKAGVDATAREMAKQGEVLREIDLTWEDKGKEVLFKCKAGRYAVKVNNETGEVCEVLLDTAFGVKRQAKTYPGGVENPHWFEHGSMKAARNAKMRLLSEDLKQQVLLVAIKEGRVQHVADGHGEMATNKRRATKPKEFENGRPHNKTNAHDPDAVAAAKELFWDALGSFMERDLSDQEARKDPDVVDTAKAMWIAATDKESMKGATVEDWEKAIAYVSAQIEGDGKGEEE